MYIICAHKYLYSYIMNYKNIFKLVNTKIELMRTLVLYLVMVYRFVSRNGLK